ncbi:hypothetical protein HDU67_008498 [Dinochytrium kinnereticum]|nr:hypothetical protein HDU67_008498 [Dinochytrium kinnereticum]
MMQRWLSIARGAPPPGDAVPRSDNGDGYSSGEDSVNSDGYLSEDVDDYEDDIDSMQMLKMMAPIVIPLLARAMGRYFMLRLLKNIIL